MLPAIVWVTEAKSCNLYQIPDASEQYTYSAVFCIAGDALRMFNFANQIQSIMKVTKFKVLLYLKKSSTDKRGKAPIMGRIILYNSMAQFSCKISCNYSAPPGNE